MVKRLKTKKDVKIKEGKVETTFVGETIKEINSYKTFETLKKKIIFRSGVNVKQFSEIKVEIIKVEIQAKLGLTTYNAKERC